MFDIYLPIAEVFINAPLLLLISTIVGLLTGMLGIGGGMLVSPLLILLQIDNNVVMATNSMTTFFSSLT